MKRWPFEQNLKKKEMNYGWIPRALLGIPVASIQGQPTGITLSLNEAFQKTDNSER